MGSRRVRIASKIMPEKRIPGSICVEFLEWLMSLSKFYISPTQLNGDSGEVWYIGSMDQRVKVAEMKSRFSFYNLSKTVITKYHHSLNSFGIYSSKLWLYVHYSNVIMSAVVSQITSLTIVYSIVYSGADQRKITKLRVTGLCEGNSPVTGEFPAQRASNAENVSIWWRHHALLLFHRAFKPRTTVNK